MSRFVRFPDELIHVSLTISNLHHIFSIVSFWFLWVLVSLSLTTPRLEFVIADVCGRTNSEEWHDFLMSYSYFCSQNCSSCILWILAENPITDPSTSKVNLPLQKTLKAVLYIPRHLQVNLPCVCETWSHFLVSCFFGVEPHLRIAGCPMAPMASMASQSWRNPLRSSCVGRMLGRWRRFYDRRFAAGAVAKSGGGLFLGKKMGPDWRRHLEEQTWKMNEYSNQTMDIKHVEASQEVMWNDANDLCFNRTLVFCARYKIRTEHVSHC